MNDGVQVTVLGAGDAFGSGGRRQSSYLVRGRSATFLMDAGPTVLAALKDAGQPSDAIDFVLLSHLHGDHFAGLPFMIMEYLYERPRGRELLIAGPAGTEQRVMDLYRAMYKEAAARPTTYPIRFETLRADMKVDIGGVTIEPFAVPHQEREPSLGLKVRLDGKTILYSGDSGWTEEFVKRTADVDLFLCECCYWETQVGFHINYPEFERNRPRIGARRVVLSHLGREVLGKLDRVKEECARDGMVIEL
ncbi:MAG TPA: MBL fold metallo-hydrolase [Candidatus Binatia bacterium]|nr:MBL fold metallo-hydrolase [Candidatus Binatia bacterium]